VFVDRVVMVYRHSTTAEMAKVGLDVICAKLSRNAAMTSTQMGPRYLPPRNDNESDCGAVSGSTAAVDTVDEQRKSSSLPSSESVDVVHHENAQMVISDELVELKAVGGTLSLMDSGYSEEDVFDVNYMDDSSVTDAGHRKRRKNFLPRCVHEQASESRQTADASTTTWSTAIANVEDGQTVLDLSTGRSSSALTRQTSDSPEIRVRTFGDDRQNQILDLSVPQCSGLFGNNVHHDIYESRITGWAGRRPAAGELNSADMRTYAMNTMSELLHIYGLPDEHLSTVTDFRKVVPPVDNSSNTGTPTHRGTELRPITQFDVAASAGGFQNREQVMMPSLSTRHMPDYVVGQMQGRTNELAHVNGT